MHIVTRITGPTHNWLALTFATDGRSPESQVIELPPHGGCDHGLLDRAKVLAAVLAGVADGNSESGADFIVSSARYVADDSGPEETYRYLARSIVEETLRYLAEQRLNSTRECD